MAGFEPNLTQKGSDDILTQKFCLSDGQWCPWFHRWIKLAYSLLCL